ncbi:5'-nucleotidase, lipoprotein e(P4) family [Zobellella maritima]|uniref:5'-nucleotidase, lipoprotein e(P4) family n=1 Tax=Zobellella maritima TaxID=2059725 RepID=UPI000E303A2C|nr:5'-nucleotidase, lipoprotein e(P4) family [Zobellella maritima]
MKLLPLYKKTVFPAILLCSVAYSGLAVAENEPKSIGDSNLLISAVAWKQTAAEYRALFYQGFNVARLHLDNALAKNNGEGKPLAIITDVDDTILSTNDYFGYLVKNNKEFFDDEAWDEWVATNRAAATPGAKEFLDYAASNGVEVFYVTSRNQGDATYDIALSNLRSNGFPFVDEQHLTVLKDSSNKEIRQQEIAKDFNVILYLGDNLNDFSREYYVNGVNERLNIVDVNKGKYGFENIIFPNPTDGHWVRAIFGESEPPASPENLEKFRSAATNKSWK